MTDASFVCGKQKLFYQSHQKTTVTVLAVTLLIQVVVDSSPLPKTLNDSQDYSSRVNIILHTSNSSPRRDVISRKDQFIRHTRSTGGKASLFLPSKDSQVSSSSTFQHHHSSPVNTYVYNSNMVSHLNSPSIPSHSLITGTNIDPSHTHFDGNWNKYPYYYHGIHELLPHNLTVVLIKWQPLPAIRVSWDFDAQLKCDAFRVLYHPIASKYRYIVEVPCSVKNITIERLLPSTEYILTVNPVPAPAPIHMISSVGPHEQQQQQQQQNHLQQQQTTPQGQTITGSKDDNVFHDNSKQGHNGLMSQNKYWHPHHNQFASIGGKGPMITPPNVIRFISPQVEFNRFSSKFRSSSLIIRRPDEQFDPDSNVVVVKTGELAVVLFVLSGWILMIIIFVKKWGKIRGIETVSSFHHANDASSVTNGVLPFATSTGTVVNGGVTSTLLPFSVSTSGVLRAQRSGESDESNSNEMSSNVIQGGSTVVNASSQLAGSLKKKRLEDALHQFLISHQQLKQTSVTSTTVPLQCRSSCSNSSYDKSFVRTFVSPRTFRSQDNGRSSVIGCYVQNCHCISPAFPSQYNRWSCHAARVVGHIRHLPGCTMHTDQQRSSLDHLDVYFTQTSCKSTSSDELKLIRDPRMNRSAENLLQLNFDTC